MTLDPKLVIWLTGSLLALLILARMMDKRRAKLTQMLQVYIESRLQWAKKHAAATRLAQEITRKKAAQESNGVQTMQEAYASPDRQGAVGGPSGGVVGHPSASGEQVKAA